MASVPYSCKCAMRYRAVFMQMRDALSFRDDVNTRCVFVP